MKAEDVQKLLKGKLYTGSEVVEIVKMVLKLNTSFLQVSQSMKEVFEIAEALNTIKEEGGIKVRRL